MPKNFLNLNFADGSQKLKSVLERYLEVNELIFQSDKKLQAILKLANYAIIYEGLILNNTLHGYLDIITCKDSLKKTSKGEIVKALAEIFDVSHDIVTLVQLEIYEESVKELVKYIENTGQRMLSEIDFLKKLVNMHENDSVETRQSGQA